MFILLVLLLAFGVGFSVRRGGICLVGATKEIIEQQSAKTLLFIIEAMTTALAITVTAAILFPEYIQFSKSHDLTFMLIGGALLYGIGAGLNGGCALGTLNRLMSGQLNFVGTILGIGLGFFLYLLVMPLEEAPDKYSLMEERRAFYYLIPILIIAWSIVGYRLWQFIRGREATSGSSLKAFLHAPIARDFIAIFVLGAGAALLYLLLGHAFDYSQWIMTFERILFKDAEISDHFIYVSLTTLGLLCGILVASIAARGFALSPVEWRLLNLKVLSGGFMGFGAGFIHGGNDTLILYGVPTTAFHAPFAIILIMVGVALVMQVQKKLNRSD